MESNRYHRPGIPQRNRYPATVPEHLSPSAPPDGKRTVNTSALRRPALAVVAATVLLAGPLALPAAADPVRGRYTGVDEHGHGIVMRGEEFTTTATFGLDLGDRTLPTYCIDFRTGIVGDAWYVEDSWADYPGEGDFSEPGRVHWILMNSYPVVEIGDLREETGIPGLTKAEALTATQAAIWHFSNGLDLEQVEQNPDLPTVSEEEVVELYELLVADARELPDEPPTALSVSPEEASGLAGETVGEFTVETSAASVPVELDAPDGVEVVDLATGEAVETVSDGDRIGLSVPADAAAGEAGLTLAAEAAVLTGRLFKGEDADEPTQTLIAAADGEITVSRTVTAAWDEAGGTPPPIASPSASPVAAAADDRGLALTGPTVAALVAVAAVLILGGLAFLLAARRRRTARD
ncbi:thioester domain-containing protein [Nocardiopsis sp. MT53]|uniref:Thioester domain-containing protein n=1 Tax=Nocardiopsis changdeensis TaxID=2831969 RepID=A0ABX8BKU3_9ACTN|nr:thioester domain-containing protein [Nocardiopsis changdeensis]QYX37865.1 thioester domain-containing protein [Nocardiopsis sp. MT53]